jgi:hypothetical protein
MSKAMRYEVWDKNELNVWHHIHDVLYGDSPLKSKSVRTKVWHKAWINVHDQVDIKIPFSQVFQEAMKNHE